MQLIDALHNIHASTTNTTLPLQTRFQDLLSVGVSALSLEIGIISRVHPINKKYTVEYVVSPGDTIAPGTEFRLGDTYCSITIRQKKVVGIAQMSISEWFRHPAYEHFKLEAYIGAPIMVFGKPYGTVNFTQATYLTTKFTPEEQDFVGTLAIIVGKLLEERVSTAF